MIAKMPLQQNTTMTHIPYIDGLKGLCGIWICLFHYLLAFAPFGFIAFLPSLRFFQTGNVASIKRQACIRYFRLMPPVLACTLLACASSGCLQKILTHPWLVRAGELSFAMVLMHFTVLMSFSAWFFLAMHNKGLSYAPTLALTLLTAIPVNVVFTLLFKHCVERPTERFAQWIYRLVA